MNPPPLRLTLGRVPHDPVEVVLYVQVRDTPI